MAGFGKSFEEAFKPANTAATAGAMDILKEKIKANNETAQANNIIDFITAKKVEQSIKSGIPEEEIKASIKQFEQAKKLGLKPDQLKMIFPEDLKDQSPINILTVGNNGTVNKAGQAPAGSKVFKQSLTSDEIGARALAQREATTENPQIDQQTQGAIAALEFVKPRLDNANALLDKIGKKEFEKLSTQIQIGSNNELLVPNGSPLEELVAELNDTKITGFGIAGSAYSVNERQVVEGGLNPIGKSFERFKRDLSRNKDFFTAKAKAGTMGLKEARGIATDGSVYSAKGSGMVTIYSKSGASKQVTLEEAKKMGVKGV